MKEKRQRILSLREDLLKNAKPVLDLKDEANVIHVLRENGKLSMISRLEEYKISETDINAFYNWAKFCYEIGEYTISSEYVIIKFKND